MAGFKKNIVVEVARGVKAYLNLDAGITRRTLEELPPKPAGTEAGGVNPENIVWIFGSGRSGSTWLSSMMRDIEGHAVWGEPWVGALFGQYYYRGVQERKHTAAHFIMGRHREAWLGSIRNFVLDMARAIFPALPEDRYLIIKEPNGSIGAPLSMEAGHRS